MSDGVILISGISLFLSGSALVYWSYMGDTRKVLGPPPGSTMVQPDFSGAEIRLAAMVQLSSESFRELAIQLKDPDSSDPFWDRLCDNEVTEESFEEELMTHLRLTDHPKGKILVKLARNATSGDLQDAYLMALDLLDLL